MAVITVVLLQASFHYCTVEEFYTGGLFLGPGNGVTDGSVVIIGLYVLMGFVGNQFFVAQITDGIRVIDVLVIVISVW
jgi:hypothetical protein